jgi:hypothetical protein
MKQLLTLLILVMVCGSVESQTYNGIYTIGGASSDFSTIKESVDSLVLYGVSGPVTMIISPGTYNEKIEFKAIPGVSSASLVEYTSGLPDSTQVVITDTSLGVSTNYLVSFDSAQYITLSGVTLRKSDTLLGTLVWIKNEVRNVHIRSCHLETPEVFNDTNSMSIVRVESATQLKHLYFENNYFLHGSFGIYTSVITGYSTDSMYVVGNQFVDQHWSCVRTCDIRRCFFIGNYFSSDHAFCGGIHIENCTTLPSNTIYVLQNNFHFENIHSWHSSPVVLESAGNLQFHNNMVYMRDAYSATQTYYAAIYISFSGGIYATNNTIFCNNTSQNTGTQIFYHGSSSSYSGEIKNNVLICLNCNYGIPVGGSYDSDYNCYYTTGLQGNPLSSLQGGGLDSNSIFHYPQFYSGTDLHSYDVLLNNTGTANMINPTVVDIDNELRSVTTPDIGADEFSYIPTDSTIVWPGDANNDSIADLTDILTIGLAFNRNGISRDTITSIWSPHWALNWADTLTNGQNYCHIDCNGDGIINAADTMAVLTNFQNIHQIAQSQNINSISSVNTLYVVADQNAYGPGDTATFHILIGDTTAQLPEIYGIAGELVFNSAAIEASTADIVFPASFLTQYNPSRLATDRINEPLGLGWFAITRTDQDSVGGYGEVARFTFVVDHALQNPVNCIVSLQNVNGITNDGGVLQFTNASDTIILDTISGINEQYQQLISNAYPVPVASMLHIPVFTEVDMITIVDLAGREMLLPKEAYRVNGGEIVIDFTICNLSAGVYILKLHKGSSISCCRVVYSPN